MFGGGIPFPSIPRRPFGRGRVYILALEDAQPILSEDFRLFMMTFVGGFLFMTVYLA